MAAQSRTTNDEHSKRIYTIQDIQKILSISRSTAYAFIRRTYENQAPFKVVRVGNSYRIVKESFDQWLDGGNTCRNLQDKPVPD